MPNADVPMMPVRQRVIRLISVCFEIPEADIRPTSTWQDHGADSLDLVELVMALEDELGVCFNTDELGAVKTVADLIDVVEQLPRLERDPSD